MLALRRGITFPNALSYRARLNSVRIMLLEGAGEEEFTRWVMARAEHYGWLGYHTRDSEGVMQSIHSVRKDGYSEALGVPDWRFWNEGLGQSFDAELKGASGVLSKHQKREIASMRRGGIVCFVWYPKDAETIERIFQHGYRQEDLCQA